MSNRRRLRPPLRPAAQELARRELLAVCRRQAAEERHRVVLKGFACTLFMVGGLVLRPVTVDHPVQIVPSPHGQVRYAREVTWLPDAPDSPHPPDPDGPNADPFLTSAATGTAPTTRIGTGTPFAGWPTGGATPTTLLWPSTVRGMPPPRWGWVA